MFIKKYDYSDKTKEELKEALKIIEYEIASTNDKRKLKQFYKKLEAINKELRRIKKEEYNVKGRGR